MEEIHELAPPERLRIGPFVYTVVWDGTDRYHDYGERGYHNQNNLQIVLCPDLPAPLLAVTFMHEVLHAIWRQYYPQANKLDHEQVAECMSQGLTQCWMDNPNACQWWQMLVQEVAVL